MTDVSTTSFLEKKKKNRCETSQRLSLVSTRDASKSRDNIRRSRFSSIFSSSLIGQNSYANKKATEPAYSACTYARLPSLFARSRLHPFGNRGQSEH